MFRLKKKKGRVQRYSQLWVRSLLSTAYYEENLWLITSFIPFNALHFVASLQLQAKIIDSFSQWWFVEGNQGLW